MKYECEIKFKLSSFEDCLKWLEEHSAVLEEPITQIDEIFIKESVNFLQTQKGDEFVRIRKMNDKVQINRKIQQLNELTNLESECEIYNLSDIYSVLKVLGFIKIIEVTKTRRVGRLDKYNICLDYVEELGGFLEFELISDAKPSEDAQEEMKAFANENNLPYENIVDQGYDTLVYIKKRKSMN